MIRDRIISAILAALAAILLGYVPLQFIIPAPAPTPPAPPVAPTPKVAPDQQRPKRRPIFPIFPRRNEQLGPDIPLCDM